MIKEDDDLERDQNNNIEKIQCENLCRVIDVIGETRGTKKPSAGGGRA
jgi:hypothetical protein